MGGMLGGGSSINFMMYTRAQGVDFDSWATPGWAAEDMIPLCKKLETYHPKDGEKVDRSKHGFDGPVHVSDGGMRILGFPLLLLDVVRVVVHSKVLPLNTRELRHIKISQSSNANSMLFRISRQERE
jgi:choline dehydrogenase-like flavoprotein